MKSEKNDIKINAIRKTFSKSFKRKVLLEISFGKKPDEVLNKYINELGSDKKYASKLIHKWRKEYYQTRESILPINYSTDNIVLDEEIEKIGDDEFDDIENYFCRMAKKLNQ